MPTARLCLSTALAVTVVATAHMVTAVTVIVHTVIAAMVGMLALTCPAPLELTTQVTRLSKSKEYVNGVCLVWRKMSILCSYSGNR